MVRRLFSASALCIAAFAASHAQVGAGSIKGKVTDKKTGEPLPFVNLVVENKGTQVNGGATDFDGNYFIKPIDPGTYDVLVSYVGYQPVKQTGVIVSSNKITFLDIQMSQGVELKEFEVVKYEVPLIDKDGGASGGTVTREDIARMPSRSAASIATTVAGASDAGTGGGISIRGARTENTYYYIDGVKVPAGAGTGLPKAAIEEVQVITGGVPANYGDVTGGVINITTRGPSRTLFGSLEYLTSGFKTGDDITDVYGLDKFAFNQVEGSLSGPIFFKKDSVGNKTKPLLGFFLSGQYTNVVDGDPYYDGDVRVRKDVRDRLLASPLSVIQLGQDENVVYNTDYLREEDFEYLDTRQNAQRNNYLATAKLDITTTPTINLSVGGSFELGRRQDYNRNNALLNPENNGRVQDLTWRTFLRFTQRFNARGEGEGEEQKATIKNAFYSIQLDFSRYDRKVEDDQLTDELFKYGHIGRFNTYRTVNYTLDPDRGAFIHDGYRDTLVTFEPGTANPDLAALTSQYFTLFDHTSYDPFNPFAEPGPYTNFEQITQRNGLINGQLPDRVYDLWNNIGQLDNDFSKRQTDQVRVAATGSADIGQHAVSVGIEYEQLSDRRYALAPVGLWTRMRQLANFHIEELDKSDSTVTYFFGTLPFITYDRLLGDGQYFFDRSLRTALGLDPDGLDYIDVDALDPSVFSLDMFSAEELINDGNYVSTFYGYDHLGNKVKGTTTFEDFFDAKDDNGNYTRLHAPFAPQYFAGYVMDKFAFDDIIFNVGVRVDRYDANQKVLKDKFLWRPAHLAGDQVPSSFVQNELNNRPSNIGDDFVVYVDDIDDPIDVVGYRDGEVWYNDDGEVLTDPSVLRQASGIAPYLVDGTDLSGDLTGSKLRKSAFEDYKPVVNVMPRIAFSFPISDEAVFFAHYDVLTQRPTQASRLDLLGYAYIENTGDNLNNAALKPTKTIDYELGFQQVLSKSSSLKISAFYRELRDMIQIRNVFEAWPVTYQTYDNLDFGTVKGFTLAYDLRHTGNVTLRAAYTLQFADGTGSGIETGINLINSGQPNLKTISPLNFDQRHRIQTNIDFRYGEGSDYNGPMIAGKPIFQRTGLNIVGILGSGTPYSASSRIINEGAGVGSHALVGSLNGSRLPWQFTTDLQLDRDIPLTFGKEEGDKAKSANLNVYLLVTNVFNTRNVTGVWRATGSPDDDGYLAAPEFQNEINSKVDPQSYSDLYALKVDNPGNYGNPRTIRIGARFDF